MNEINAEALLRFMEKHIGADRGISSRDLSIGLVGYSNGNTERRIRTIIQGARLVGYQLCGHPDTGYFMAATPEELDRTCKFLVDRAMTTLKQVSRMKKLAMPDLYGQFRITQ